MIIFVVLILNYMTKIYNISFLILAFCSTSVFAQRTYETNPDAKRANVWIFENYNRVDFNNQIVPLSNPKIYNSEGSSVLCDKNGNLVLFSNGDSLWDKDNKLINIDFKLKGSYTSRQGVLLISHPLINNIVYIFCSDAQGGINGFNYSVYDLENDSFLLKNKQLINRTNESISATLHKNGLDIWICVHGFNNDIYNSFLLTKNGLNECQTSSNTGEVYWGSTWDAQTNIKFSPNGKYIASTFVSKPRVEILNFDNETGKVIFNFAFNKNISQGIEFSNSSKFLYCTFRDSGIYSLNLLNKNIKKISDTKLVQQMQLASNGTIYIVNYDSAFLSSIENTNSINSTYNRKSMLLNQKGVSGLPNFNQSNFYTPSINFSYQINCHTNNIELKGQDTFYADFHSWYTKKKQSVNNYSLIGNSKNLNYLITDTGLFEFRYIAEKGNRKDTVIKTITVYPKINKNFLGNDTTYEIGMPINKILKAPDNIHCQNWYYQDTLRSSSPNYSATQKGTYICRVTSKSFCEVWDTIVINECINNLQEPSLFRSRDTLRTWHINADSFVWYKNNQFYKVTKHPFLALTDTGTYRVEATKQGHCNRSSVGQLIVNKLSVNNISFEDLNIRIYPNPNNGILNIFNSNNNTMSFEISNSLGQIVYSNEINIGENIFNTKLKSGMYTLIFHKSNQTYYHKLIIQ
jgi:hypothetical protein